jgi:hypothetical protein
MDEASKVPVRKRGCVSGTVGEVEMDTESPVIDDRKRARIRCVAFECCRSSFPCGDLTVSK